MLRGIVKLVRWLVAQRDVSKAAREIFLDRIYRIDRIKKGAGT